MLLKVVLVSVTCSGGLTVGVLQFTTEGRGVEQGQPPQSDLTDTRNTCTLLEQSTANVFTYCVLVIACY